MSEKGFDLNAFRRSAEGKPEKTKEDEILELKATIARLEEEAKGPSPAEKFMQLSQEEQEVRLAELNAGQLPDDQYTLAEYIEELSEKGGPKLINLRLNVAKAKLQRLLDSK